jgi:hypothetical protein
VRLERPFLSVGLVGSGGVEWGNDVDELRLVGKGLGSEVVSLSLFSEGFSNGFVKIGLSLLGEGGTWGRESGILVAIIANVRPCSLSVRRGRPQ